MNKYLGFTALLLLGMIVTSCNTTLYVPNAVNAPLLKEKGELKASIGGNNFQAAFGVSDNIGIIGNVYWNKFQEDITNNGITTETLNKGKLYELGVGYFTKLTDNVVFETYVGGGLGNIDFNNEGSGKYYDVKATKFFVQPAVGYVSRFFDIAFTPRLSAVKYNDLNTAGYTPDELITEYLVKSDVEGKTWLFIEPAFTIRGGYKFVKLQFQYGFASKRTSGDLKYESKFSSLGISFDIAKWYKKGNE